MYLFSCSAPEPKYEQVFIGTYTGSGSEGIYSSLLNIESGELTRPILSAKTENPSFLAIYANDSLDHKVFAVNEVSRFGIDTSGAISVFGVHVMATWSPVRQVSSKGTSPCHISIDRSGRFLLVANYSGGTVAVYRLDHRGNPGELTAMVKHEGSGPDAKRQDKPHPHYIQTTRDNQLVLVADLGIDKVMVYRFDSKTGSLTPNDPPFVDLPPGAGPRHLVLDRSGTRMYVLNELNATISFFIMDPLSGRFELKQTVSTLPPDFNGSNTAAEIILDSHGDLLYASNRGHDSMVMYEVMKSTGALANPNWTATGKGPRHFSLDLTGKWLLVANQYDNSVDVFAVDHENRKLRKTTNKIEINSPVCVKFVGAE